jgi:hypothetical protein
MADAFTVPVTDTNGELVFIDRDHASLLAACQEASRAANIPFLGFFGSVNEPGKVHVVKQLSKADGTVSTDASAYNNLDYVKSVAVPETGATVFHVLCAYEEKLSLLMHVFDVHSADSVRALALQRSGTGKHAGHYVINMVNACALDLFIDRLGSEFVFGHLLADVPGHPYIAEAEISVVMMEKLFHFLELLPAELREKQWDCRWAMFYKVQTGKELSKLTAATAGDDNMEVSDPPLAPAPSAPPASPIVAATTTCTVCLDRVADTIVIPCGHCVVCHTCSDDLKSDPVNARLCVVCRQRIDGIYNGHTDEVEEVASGKD